MFNYNEEQKKELNSLSNDGKTWGNYSGWRRNFWPKNSYRWGKLYDRIYNEGPVMGFEAIEEENTYKSGYTVTETSSGNFDVSENSLPSSNLSIRQIDTIGDYLIKKYVETWLKYLEKYTFGVPKTILLILLWVAFTVMICIKTTFFYALSFVLPLSIILTGYWIFRFVQVCIRRNAYKKALKRWKYLKNH